ncbi:Uncharacterized protein HZ326_7013 [Fusarium oxysporum f. sp. albedinis]|nr:Uncharacterized protein HZ326_7013 [Fusarium oxysporum f. sp. albedinis]
MCSTSRGRSIRVRSAGCGGSDMLPIILGPHSERSESCLSLTGAPLSRSEMLKKAEGVPVISELKLNLQGTKQLGQPVIRTH